VAHDIYFSDYFDLAGTVNGKKTQNHWRSTRSQLYYKYYLPPAYPLSTDSVHRHHVMFVLNLHSLTFEFLLSPKSNLLQLRISSGKSTAVVDNLENISPINVFAKTVNMSE
jgi:hypothetical protein